MTLSAARAVLLPLAVAFILTAGASGQTLSNSDCLGCHNDPTATKDVDGKQISVFVDGAKFEKSVHSPLSCTDCHADIKEYPHPSPVKTVDCSGCHADPVKEYATSVHAKGRARGNMNAATCVDCHGKHDILPKSDPASRTNRFNTPRTCASCHESQKVTQSHPMPNAAQIEKYFTSVHGKGTIEKGLVVSAICTDCHRAHDIRLHDDPESSISHQNVPKTCSKCHEGIFNQFTQSTHGQLWEKNDPKGPVCVTCHSAHGIGATQTGAFRNAIATGCSNCHEKEAPTYRDSFHGQATALGFAPAAKCSDCHTPHLNLPKSDPRSSVSSQNVVSTCRKCHPNATASFASFQPHADPHSKAKSPQIYYVYNWGMKWLLLIVFGFFGLHTLLWLQRSIVGAMRHEFHHPEPAPGTQWVKRFTKYHRLTHIAIVTSFLALAATGLPLMYSHMPWGTGLAHLFGGVGVTTAIHRFFAIVTFGYALAHLLFIIRRGIVERNLRLWFGPDSMVPGVRDVVDMKNMIRWFLYLGPRPRLDRFTYWEKFDYFAVFWGVPVIGFSGLMLWLPGFFTSFLPGWALNVAMLVHSDEALLAIGFIFTFHFFHTHLRPESFPLDPVMFTGRMTMEKFMEERPDQYERLHREGRLEEVLTSPPTEGQISFSKWFGFTTLTIGVILIIGIYWSFIERTFM